MLTCCDGRRQQQVDADYEASCTDLSRECSLTSHACTEAMRKRPTCARSKKPRERKRPQEAGMKAAHRPKSENCDRKSAATASSPTRAQPSSDSRVDADGSKSGIYSLTWLFAALAHQPPSLCQPCDCPTMCVEKREGQRKRGASSGSSCSTDDSSECASSDEEGAAEEEEEEESFAAARVHDNQFLLL